MKITLKIEGLAVELGANTAEIVAGNLPDTEEYEAAYAALAKHAYSPVRVAVAGKDNLREETVALLAKDPVPEVRRNLVQSEAGRRHLDEATLRTLAANDVECAETIASSLGQYDLKGETLAEILAQHPDPRVRLAAAGCSSTPKRLLKKLAKDAEPSVRSEAKASLSA